MALKSTIFKVHLSVSDINRGYYEDHTLTIARHPSETDLRMLVRIVAFAANAHEHLQFTKGLADADEPDLWQIDLQGNIEHWIDLGQPTEKRIRQSCSKANRVSIYTFQKGAMEAWFETIKNEIERFKHLSIIYLAIRDDSSFDKFIDRTMRLSCVIEENRILLSDDENSLSFEFKYLKKA